MSRRKEAHLSTNVIAIIVSSFPATHDVKASTTALGWYTPLATMEARASRTITFMVAEGPEQANSRSCRRISALTTELPTTSADAARLANALRSLRGCSNCEGPG